LQEFFEAGTAPCPAIRSLAIAGLVLAGVAAGCSRNEAPDPATPAPPAESSDPFAELEPPSMDSNCGDNAFFSGRFFGAIELAADWRGGDLHCAGEPRPKGNGARLRFAHPLEGGGDMAVIITLPALTPGTTPEETAAQATLIIEEEARFFSTQGNENCWADIEMHDRVIDEHYAVSGTLYCIAPLPEVNGAEAITVSDLAFRGFVDWSDS
jgi:hypothetical protein